MKDEEGRVVCEASTMLREPRPLLEYKIERAQAEDSLEINRVRVRAFVSLSIFSAVTAEATLQSGQDVFFDLVWPPSKVDADDLAACTSRTWTAQNSYDSPTVHTFKAVLPNGKIIGLARWIDCFREAELPAPLNPNEWPKGTNIDVLQPACQAAFDTLQRVSKGNPFCGRSLAISLPVLTASSELDALGVDPDYRQRGVGSALIKAGLAVVERRGLPIILESSAQGEPLYRCFGWQTVDTKPLLVQDGKVVLECPVMLKEAS
jgi:ribosomal protein S18 acetylase RimI-like enzyme